MRAIARASDVLGEVAPFLDPHHGVTRMVNNQRWDSNRRQNVAHVDRRVHAFQRHGGASYDAARTVWNGRIDRRPALIARCAGAADVIAAVNFARTNELLVAICGGGHSPPGHAVCDDGLMIDLSRMKSIRVDPLAQTALAEPGVLWGEFDRETQAFGLATTGGVVSTIGVAGLTLGGGVGWLNGKYGLACDNLISVDVVTAAGELLRASATEN